MPVEVSPLNILGAASVGTNLGTFSDNFTRANDSSWGVNWTQNNLESGASVCNLSLQINANLGRIIQTAAGSPTALFVPTPMLWLLAQPTQRNQFCQFAWQAVSNNVSDIYV